MVEDLQQEAAKTYLVSPIFQTLEVDISSRQVEAGAVEEVLIFSPRSSIQIKAEGDQVLLGSVGDKVEHILRPLMRQPNYIKEIFSL